MCWILLWTPWHIASTLFSLVEIFWIWNYDKLLCSYSFAVFWYRHQVYCYSFIFTQSNTSRHPCDGKKSFYFKDCFNLQIHANYLDCRVILQSLRELIQPLPWETHLVCEDMEQFPRMWSEGTGLRQSCAVEGLMGHIRWLDEPRKCFFPFFIHQIFYQIFYPSDMFEGKID